MQSTTVNNIEYYLGSDLMKTAQLFSRDCKISRDYKNKGIVPASDYIFVKKVNHVWIETDGKNKKFDVIAIKKDYVDNNNSIKQELNGNNMCDSKGVRKAPEILILNDNEKFKDDLGNRDAWQKK